MAKTDDVNKKISVLVAGYGDFGSKLVDWLLTKQDFIKIVGVVEPDKSKHTQIRIRGLTPFVNIGNLLQSVSEKLSVVVDCATQHQGASNLGRYKELGLPAVFQNGESVDLAELCYEPFLQEAPKSPYLKIVRCSGLSTLNVLLALPGATKGNLSGLVESVHAYHFKVNNHDKMISLDYKSGREIEKLTGIPTRVDVLYVRGESYNGYAYHGALRIKLKSGVKMSRKTLLKSLALSRNISLVSSDIDTLSCERVENTLVIADSIVINGPEISLMVLSFTPEINFPHNLAGITSLAKK